MEPNEPLLDPPLKTIDSRESMQKNLCGHLVLTDVLLRYGLHVFPYMYNP